MDGNKRSFEGYCCKFLSQGYQSHFNSHLIESTEYSESCRAEFCWWLSAKHGSFISSETENLAESTSPPFLSKLPPVTLCSRIDRLGAHEHLIWIVLCLNGRKPVTVAQPLLSMSLSWTERWIRVIDIHAQGPWVCALDGVNPAIQETLATS